MRGNLLVGLLAAAIIGFAGWYFLAGNRATPVEETPVVEFSGENPVLSIEVAGQANGVIRIELLPRVAPAHVARVTELATSGAYDNVIFHRVIDGFMAQTGDVRFGVSGSDTSRAGMGGSDLPDLAAEFSDIPFERGVLGMARAANPNSANSQFFIMFAEAPSLNGQYTVLGRVIDGLDVLDDIKRGLGPNGAVLGEPDKMVRVSVN